VVPRNHPTETVAKLIKVLPKSAEVHVHRTGAVRLPQLLHSLSHEHERDSTPFVLLDPVECTADRGKERSQE